jgi:acyl-coenzyme A thioesterase PaaI-like protein
MAMDQPSRASRSAVARPMPRADAAPVMTAVRSAGNGFSPSIALLPSSRGQATVIVPRIGRTGQRRRWASSSSTLGRISLAFAATKAFTNPSGNVLGAFLSAMPYDTVGPALLEPDQVQSTLQLNASFLGPGRPGRLLAKGRIVHRDGHLGLLEAVLCDADGAVTASATATAWVIPLRDAQPRRDR